MQTTFPVMREFRTEATDDGIVHLIFDCPGRSVNVLSHAAVRDLEGFATWLENSDARGVVVRSGKAAGFCVGADLGEMSAACDMIMAAPQADGKRVARELYGVFGRAFRRLETAGKPVAVAVSGLALGGGCEFVLACHFRVLTAAPHTRLGLPESVIGLLPGCGGTQRLPRLVGLDRALPILLDGDQFDSRAALAAGAADMVVAAGEEIGTAEAWVRVASDIAQPWDRPSWTLPPQETIDILLAPLREKILRETGGHYPAPLAILDCVERGLPKPFDAAMEVELSIFTDLLRRPEPRNMIRVMFMGKQHYERRRKAGNLPKQLPEFLASVKAAVAGAAALRGTQGHAALTFAGFAPQPNPKAASNIRSIPWFERPTSAVEDDARQILAAAAAAARRAEAAIPSSDRGLADYAAVTEINFPSYLGGPFNIAPLFTE